MTAKEAGPIGRLLSEVVPERVDWLWPERIPKGKLTIFEGDPGEGKSAAATDIGARVSVGRSWPDGAPCNAGGVVLCSAEDGEADTLRPRLDAAGGDPEKVLALATVRDGDSERLLSIPEDLNTLRLGMERVGATLAVIDSLSAFLSGDVDSHKNQGVRRALAPLAKLAEETGAALLVVRHLNKGNGGNPLYRGGGSTGIVGAARSAFLVAKHPQDERRRVLAPVKSNLAKPAPSLAFVLSEAANGAVIVEWKGETPHTAAALLSAPKDPEERSALDEATVFLTGALGNGPVWSNAVKRDARAAEISDATLRRAKTALGVRSVKEADGSWYWALSEDDQRSRPDEHKHLEPLEHLPIDEPHSRGPDQGQGAQREHLETWDGSRMSKANTLNDGEQGTQDAHWLRTERLETCIHDHPGGTGCYLCDAEHPYRRQQEDGK